MKIQSLEERSAEIEEVLNEHPREEQERLKRRIGAMLVARARLLSTLEGRREAASRGHG
ncbi:hypothetical protein ACSNN7_04440 [Micromonospora sp. URMC 105]|uniref:hypothetical protein n=1 Tax=Micromonospora sp. URMC 105 TaxID=3423413 RepID=UPI003F1B4E43